MAPSMGMNVSMTMITTKASVIPIQTQGDAANSRQPSLHQARPLPAATEAAGDGGEAPAARDSNPIAVDESARGRVGSVMGRHAGNG